MSDILKIAEQLRQQYADRLPPVQQWNPELSGTMDMRIDRQGKWFHEGEEILRLPLVKLFSSILKREGDSYYLITPVEKWKITVEDAPFIVVACEFKRAGELNKLKGVSSKHQDINDDQQIICFTTLTGDFIVVDDEHPIWVESDDSEPVPYVMVRNDMPALIGRNVYYQLANLALENIDEAGAGDVAVYSAGQKFSLTPK